MYLVIFTTIQFLLYLQSLLDCKMQKLYPVLFAIRNFFSCKKITNANKKVSHFTNFVTLEENGSMVHVLSVIIEINNSSQQNY